MSIQNRITHTRHKREHFYVKLERLISYFLQVNSTINFTIINYELQGNLSEMRPLKMSDLNLCNKFAAFPQNWQQNIKFTRNYFSKCAVNLREFIALQPDMKFSTLYLNYYENQANFLQTVPILIRNAYKANEVSNFCCESSSLFTLHPCILLRTNEHGQWNETQIFYIF